MAITQRRISGAGHSENWPAGAIAHTGNPHTVGQELPLLVVSVYPDEFGAGVPGVNGQVFLDGNDVLWMTSAKEGIEPGTWHWPERVNA